MNQAQHLSADQVRSALASLVDIHRENSNYRLQNYLNCVDDYSFGGICDQAQDQKEGQMIRLLHLLEEQEANGGFLEEEVQELELQTLDGEFLSNNIVNGRFGYCFMYGTEETGMNFVGLSKKQSTYQKKGLQVVTRKYLLKVVYTGRLTNKGTAARVVELISKSESIDSSVDCTIDNRNYSLWILKTA